MSVAPISNVGTASAAGISVTSAVHAGGASSSGAMSTSASSSSSSSSASDTKTIVTMADGETVTTVRNKANEIVSISTTPATRPPEIKSYEGSASPSVGKINLTA